MTSLIFCLTHIGNRTRIQICFLCPCHSVILCLQQVEVYDSLGQYFVRDNFFLALRKTSMKPIGILIGVKQILVNKVMKGII